MHLYVCTYVYLDAQVSERAGLYWSSGSMQIQRKTARPFCGSSSSSPPLLFLLLFLLLLILCLLLIVHEPRWLLVALLIIAAGISFHWAEALPTILKQGSSSVTDKNLLHSSYPHLYPHLCLFVCVHLETTYPTFCCLSKAYSAFSATGKFVAIFCYIRSSCLVERIWRIQALVLGRPALQQPCRHQQIQVAIVCGAARGQ